MGKISAFDIFDKAFEIILGEIFCSKKLPQAFKNGLLKAFNDGNNRKGEEVASSYLLQGKSGWLSNPSIEHYLFIEQFVSRLNLLTYGFIRKKSLEENADNRPYWTIVCGGRGKCKLRHLENIARRYDSVFWKNHMPPCDDKQCGCRVRAFDEDGIIEHGILVLRD